VLKNFCDDSDDDDGWPKDEEEGGNRAGFFSIKFEEEQNGTDPIEEELLPSKHKLFKSGFHLESDGKMEENQVTEKYV